MLPFLAAGVKHASTITHDQVQHRADLRQRANAAALSTHVVPGCGEAAGRPAPPQTSRPWTNYARPSQIDSDRRAHYLWIKRQAVPERRLEGAHARGKRGDASGPAAGSEIGTGDFAGRALVSWSCA